MQRRRFVATAIGWTLLGGGACTSAGCGTVFWGDRCGRPHSHRIDWRIVALDGLGLLLFFIPGVVAFVVDFSTGAIYLPLEPEYPHHGDWSPPPSAPLPPSAPPPPTAEIPPAPTPASPRLPAPPSSATSALPLRSRLPSPNTVEMTRVAIPRGELSAARIEQVASRHVGRMIVLDEEATRYSPLASLDGFGVQTRRHQSDRNFGAPLRDLWKFVSRRSAGGSSDTA